MLLPRWYKLIKMVDKEVRRVPCGLRWRVAAVLLCWLRLQEKWAQCLLKFYGTA